MSKEDVLDENGYHIGSVEDHLKDEKKSPKPAETPVKEEKKPAKKK